MSATPPPSERPPDLLDALAEAEREAMRTPSTQDQAQTWERVVGTIATGTPAGPADITGPAAASTTVWLKSILGIVLVGVVAAAGYRLASDPEPAATAASTRQFEPAPPRPLIETPTPPEPAVAPSQAVTPSVQTPPTPHEAVVPKKARAAPAEPDPPPASTLAEETRLLARARAHLRAGSPRDALAPLREHARRFAQGQLTEDRLALLAQASCEAGDARGGAKATTALLEAFPESSHLPRVRRACGEQAPSQP